MNLRLIEWPTPNFGLWSESVLIARKCWGCGERAVYGVAL